MWPKTMFYLPHSQQWWVPFSWRLLRWASESKDTPGLPFQMWPCHFMTFHGLDTPKTPAAPVVGIGMSIGVWVYTASNLTEHHLLLKCLWIFVVWPSSYLIANLNSTSLSLLIDEAHDNWRHRSSMCALTAASHSPHWSLSSPTIPFEALIRSFIPIWKTGVEIVHPAVILYFQRLLVCNK